MNSRVDPSVEAYLAEVDAELRRRAASRAELSLHTFFKEIAWPIIEPRREFIDNWHLEAIAEHLEAVTAGQISRLCINVPFRTSKSTLVSVAWPAWVWLKDPGFQWLCGSYAEKLAIRDSLKMRRLVSHPDFQALWSDRFQITGDQNQKVRWQNDKNGYRIAFGMTGGVMGDGGDALLLDDPHDRQGAHSEAERETALTTYDESLVSRLNDPATSPIVLIMQRLHRKDLSGHVLEEGGWDHLMLPMEAELERRCRTSIGFKDPRTKEGELLWPARFPRDAVDKLKAVLREYGTAGQLQQRPAPAGGGILKIAHFQLWPRTKPLPDFFYVLQSYDTAFTEDTSNDPTACTVWGVFMLGTKKCAMLLDAWDEYLKYPDAKKRIMDDWGAKYGGLKQANGKPDPLHPPRKPDQMIIEDKGSGIAVIQELRLANAPVHAYNPGKASKVARAHIASDPLEADVFYVIESGREKDKPISWARTFLTQCEEFPNGEHDDYVDTFTQASRYLTHSDLLPAPVVPADVVEEIDYVSRKKKVNPYG